MAGMFTPGDCPDITLKLTEGSGTLLRPVVVIDPALYILIRDLLDRGNDSGEFVQLPSAPPTPPTTTPLPKGPSLGGRQDFYNKRRGGNLN